MKRKIAATLMTIPVTCLLLFQTAAAQNADVGEFLKPDSAKECAICHYLWVDTFYKDHTGTAIARRPLVPEAADAEMCFSCHDGSTVDSRRQVFNDRRHQVGVIPSDKIQVPDIFPLDAEGKMTCSTCHSAHGVSTEPGIEKTIFLRTSHKDSEMCRMCHTDKTGGPEKGNHPVDVTSLSVPEELTRRGAYTGSKANQVICETCHVAHGGFTDNRLVLPVDRPGRFPVLCETCHGTRPGLSSDPRRNRFSHSVDVRPVQADIPSAWADGNQVRQGPRKELLCVTCHAVHNPAEPESLLTEKNTGDSFCLRCHNRLADTISGTKHDPAGMDDKSAQAAGPCSSCHLVHEGAGPFMWSRPLAGTQHAGIEICSSCHAQDQCAAEVPIPAGSHPPSGPAADCTVPDTFPLFTDSGQTGSQGAIYCSTCHNTHQWDPQNPDNKGGPDLKGDAATSFLRKGNRKSLLCLECHRRESAVEQTDHDLSQAAPEEKNILGQTAEQSGVCGACHIAHGGSGRYMWSRTPEAGQEPFMTLLCTDCHRSGGCASEKQPGPYSHPTGMAAGDGIQTGLPLFSARGLQEAGGNVYCSTCHDPHQWSPRDQNIRGEEGTSADSFLRQPASGSGAPLCSECHPEKAHIEATDHDLGLTAPEEKNRAGELPGQSGLCGACHAVHNALTGPFIWGRDLGPSHVAGWNSDFTGRENLMVQLCTGCHAENKCAAGKIPAYGLHPGWLYIATIQRASGRQDTEALEQFMDTFPVFTAAGDLSADGNIVCSTCHDSHVWDAHTPTKGPGIAAEGNATNSFLRRDISFTFCSVCHGEDALLKFKYFHSIKGRKE